MLVQADTHRAGTHQDPSTPDHPLFTATDAEPLNTVLRVLICGPEWGGAE